jgi:K+-transporting ATPase ATPase C chain
MWRYISKSILLLSLSVALCCGLYPLALWSVGQLVFPAQANGSLIMGDNGKPLGSRLIAQPFTLDGYFRPRPSAASYNAAASASSSLAASNYALRDRVARMLGPLARFADGPQSGQPVSPELERWFAKDRYRSQPHIVAQWATLHPSLAQAWVKADPLHRAMVEDWANATDGVNAASLSGTGAAIATDGVNAASLSGTGAATAPALPTANAVDLAVVFFQHFSEDHPGKFPGVKSPVSTGPEIQTLFFDLWREDHPQQSLKKAPGDLVTTSASGLDPHITLDNANYQLDRVADNWASALTRDRDMVRREIEVMLQANAAAPLGGLAGEKLINVLEVNVELHRRFGVR